MRKQSIKIKVDCNRGGEDTIKPKQCIKNEENDYKDDLLKYLISNKQQQIQPNLYQNNINLLFNTIDTNRIYLDEAQNRHYNKWRILGLDSGSPEVYPIPTSYDEELNRYKYFFDKRIQWIDSNLTGHCYLAPVDTTQPEDTLSITYNESDNRLLNIYPNPTNNIAYIKLDNRYAIHKVTVLNLIGKQVYEEMINLYSNFYKLDMSEYATGSYIIQIEDLKGNKFIKKIFKE